MEKKVSIAVRLKQVMSERNLKQADILRLAKPICEKYNVTLVKTCLSDYINGKYEPGQKRTLVLAEALSVNPTWLMGYDVPMEMDFQEYQNNNIKYSLSISQNFNNDNLDKTEMLYKTYKHILNEDDLDTIDFIITKRANEKAKKDKVSNNN